MLNSKRSFFIGSDGIQEAVSTKKKENSAIRLKIHLSDVSKKLFLQKRKENRLKTHLSDGIQEAVSTKKKENFANRLKTHLSDGIQEAISTKKKKNSAIGPKI